MEIYQTGFPLGRSRRTDMLECIDLFSLRGGDSNEMCDVNFFHFPIVRSLGLQLPFPIEHRFASFVGIIQVSTYTAFFFNNLWATVTGFQPIVSRS